MGLQSVLLARNLTRNSDTAPNYKYMYMFEPHSGSLSSHHFDETKQRAQRQFEARTQNKIKNNKKKKKNNPPVPNPPPPPPTPLRK